MERLTIRCHFTVAGRRATRIGFISVRIAIRRRARRKRREEHEIKNYNERDEWDGLLSRTKDWQCYIVEFINHAATLVSKGMGVG